MASIKIFDLSSPLPASIGRQEEFIGAVENAVIRALEARQLQDIRGGLQPLTTEVMPKQPTLVGFRAVPTEVMPKQPTLVGFRAVP
ncbi:hypothetical protein H6F50_17125 [Coleofasciculus sp. FACHB-712]|uniref:hypothetical protein n=1 Tax=Coleofasciculus sp. FACHB-712 TaxID=2692789 RepID=UPI0016873C90|nr:hypothetical protein [Coleofasciculus sp. FACHB-712]MBD1944064.1 hypothetical protein [Coleofasciculus sp. FACHB-712]